MYKQQVSTLEAGKSVEKYSKHSSWTALINQYIQINNNHHSTAVDSPKFNTWCEVAYIDIKNQKPCEDLKGLHIWTHPYPYDEQWHSLQPANYPQYSYNASKHLDFHIGIKFIDVVVSSPLSSCS